MNSTLVKFNIKILSHVFIIYEFLYKICVLVCYTNYKYNIIVSVKI